MKEWAPGREMDVAVHRALWPEQAIEWRGTDTDSLGGANLWTSYARPMASVDRIVWTEIPRYSTDLAAWDWTREGWQWSVFSFWKVWRHQDVVEVVLSMWSEDGIWIARAPLLALNRVQAVESCARSQCVLQWAGEKEE